MLGKVIFFIYFYFFERYVNKKKKIEIQTKRGKDEGSHQEVWPLSPALTTCIVYEPPRKEKNSSLRYTRR